MNNIYDNGEIVLGSVENVEKYLIKYAEESDEIEDILQDLSELKGDYLVAINYDIGMGYSMDFWDIKRDYVYGNEVEENE